MNTADLKLVIANHVKREAEQKAVIAELIEDNRELKYALQELVVYAPGRYATDPRCDDAIEAGKETAFKNAVAVLAQ